MSETDEDRAVVLAVLERSHEGWGRLAREFHSMGSGARVAQSHGYADEALFGDTSAWTDDVAKWQARLHQWEATGMRVATVVDASFPERLLAMKQLPPFICLRGTSDPLDERSVAIIGSRTASQRGLHAARSVAGELARRGVVITSGLARGVDTQAHLGALMAGGRTVAIIGTGLERAYPPDNRDLQDRIAAEGLLVSRFLPDAPPSKFTFPLRNELMAAWSRATLVIEANDRSGARLQARLAVQLGRRLLLYEGLHAEAWAREYVQQNKASFVRTPDDVMALL